MREHRSGAFVAVVLLLALLYIVSPVDFIPDFIPVVGWLDDLLIGAGAGATALRSATR
jgi:uncharacterized membrane protein YkvA (DUF1232 family)